MSEVALAPLFEAIHAIEGRLLKTWAESPRLREVWTPDPDEFTSPRARAIAAASKVAEGHSEDWATAVMFELNRSGSLKRLWNLGEPVYPLNGFSDPLAELARLRELRAHVELASSLSKLLLGVSTGRTLSETQNAITEALAASRDIQGSVSYSEPELLRTAYELTAKPRTGGTNCGFSQLDDLCGGLRAGHIWALGAPTNWGKSSFLLSLLDSWLLAGRRALYITCEDAPELLASRLLARRGKLPGKALRDGRLSQSELQSAADIVAKSSGDYPVMLDGRGRCAEDLVGDVRAITRAHGVNMVLLDYIGCVGTRRDFKGDRRAEINYVGRSMTDAVKTNGASGVFASQLTGEDKLRESRDLEHAAEVVLIGRKGQDGVREIYVQKNKTGPAGAVIPLGWDETSGSFHDVEAIGREVLEEEFFWDN